MRGLPMLKHLAVFCLVATLLACASPAPRAIAEAPPGDPQPDAVRSKVDSFKGQAVRWGGVVMGMQNLKDETRIEILARPLDSEGQPRSVDRNLGRFIARVPHFIDPANYPREREVTVSGKVAGTLDRTIGEHPYTYILVDASLVHLWPQRVEYDPAPRYYDPFWDYPWGPGYPWYPHWPYRYYR